MWNPFKRNHLKRAVKYHKKSREDNKEVTETLFSIDDNLDGIFLKNMKGENEGLSGSYEKREEKFAEEDYKPAANSEKEKDKMYRRMKRESKYGDKDPQEIEDDRSALNQAEAELNKVHDYLQETFENYVNNSTPLIENGEKDIEEFKKKVKQDFEPVLKGYESIISDMKQVLEEAKNNDVQNTLKAFKTVRQNEEKVRQTAYQMSGEVRDLYETKIENIKERKENLENFIQELDKGIEEAYESNEFKNVQEAFKDLGKEYPNLPIFLGKKGKNKAKKGYQITKNSAEKIKNKGKKILKRK